MRVVNYVIEEANIDWLSWCWKKKNQQDRAVSAPDSKFPIIAYHQNALPSGSRRRWPHLVGHLRVWNLLLECTRNRVGAANGKRTPAQIKKKEKVHSGCDKGMKKVTLRSGWTYREVWILRSPLEKESTCSGNNHSDANSSLRGRSSVYSFHRIKLAESE